jgi:prolyl 4-hydroxylase
MAVLLAPRRGSYLLFWLVVASALLPTALASFWPWGGARSATFTLFDNGASQGGVNVTLTAEEFSQLLKSNAKNDEAVPPSESFAVAMSSKIEVSKYMAEKPVIATRAFREDGELITTFDQLSPAKDDPTQLRRIYLVADDLEFVWPFVELGHNQTISPNVVPPTPNAGPIVLESVSESPRVFRVYNMANEQEANAIIASAHNATGQNALKRSTVGSGTDEDGNECKYQFI